MPQRITQRMRPPPTVPFRDAAVRFEIADVKQILVVDACGVSPDGIHFEGAELLAEGDVAVIIETGVAEYEDGVFVLESY